MIVLEHGGGVAMQRQERREMMTFASWIILDRHFLRK
jgi:hypothetical protein